MFDGVGKWPDAGLDRQARRGNMADGDRTGLNISRWIP
jgi:hypothetical protein